MLKKELRCNNCGGTGLGNFMLGYGMSRCPCWECEGTGVEKDVVLCKSCKGSGKIWFVFTCKDCSGTGRGNI